MEINSIRYYFSFLDAVMADPSWYQLRRGKILWALKMVNPLKHFSHLHIIIDHHDTDTLYSTVCANTDFENLFLYMMENSFHRSLEGHLVKPLKVELKIRSSHLHTLRPLSNPRNEIKKALKCIERVKTSKHFKHPECRKRIEVFEAYVQENFLSTASYKLKV
ncbi:MAG: hypothetical protein WC222_08380 [Parachlamydiales bacterium]|jgi:hypothetical protein